MNLLLVIATAEIKTLFRERILFFLLGVFIFMAFISAFIGWSTYTTTSAVYRTSVIFLHNQGVVQIPVNPILSFPPLASFRNIIIYMFLIGSLIAIVIGNRSFIRERKSGTLQLTFTRSISRETFLWGKILGICLTLSGIIAITAVVSIGTSYFLPLQHLGASDVIRIVVFYIYSFFYLLLFAFLGLLFSILAKSESLALFIPVCIWVGVSLVMPELITGQTPTALLNPVTIDQVVSQGSFFTFTQQFLSPIALGWHYTTIGGQLLNAVADTHSVIGILLQYLNYLIALVIALVTACVFCFSALKRYDIVNDTVKE